MRAAIWKGAGVMELGEVPAPVIGQVSTPSPSPYTASA